MIKFFRTKKNFLKVLGWFPEILHTQPTYMEKSQDLLIKKVQNFVTALPITLSFTSYFFFLIIADCHIDIRVLLAAKFC